MSYQDCQRAERQIAAAAELALVREMIAAANKSILHLLAKTNQTVSFGDQSFGLADVAKLKAIRDQLRVEEKSLIGAANPERPRRTIKIHF